MLATDTGICRPPSDVFEDTGARMEQRRRGIVSSSTGRADVFRQPMTHAARAICFAGSCANPQRRFAPMALSRVDQARPPPRC